jgi:seryl-tRNA synthetase
MIDIKLVRDELEKVKIGLVKKGIKASDVDEVFELDKKYRELLSVLEGYKAEQNRMTDQISSEKDNEERNKKINQMQDLKGEIKKLDSKVSEIKESFEEKFNALPNIPSPDMPEGKDESENVVIKKYGEVPNFNFKVRDHIEIGKDLDIIDVEKSAEVSGSRFFYLKGDAVLLQFALVSHTFSVLSDEAVLKKLIEENNLNVSAKVFIPMLPPVIMKKEIQQKMGRFLGDQTYEIKNEEQTLVGSAEHTLASYHMNEILKEEELPIRYIGYSTAFRREAGTYGKDMGGILRVHQFDKLEMETFARAEDGKDEQKLIVALQEYLVQSLGVPYQLVHICTGDTGKPDYDQYDIECWMPGQEKYRETHTSDYMTDYQARSLKIRYATKEGKKEFVHMNDATAFAISRILIAILENNQQEDGSIKIPEVLRKYLGGREEIGKKK